MTTRTPSVLPTVIVVVMGSLFLFAAIGRIFDGGFGGSVEALQVVTGRHGLCFKHEVRSSILKRWQCRTTATATTTALKAAAIYSSREDDTTHNGGGLEVTEDDLESVDDVKSQAGISGNDELKTKIDARRERYDKIWLQRYREMKQYQIANNGSSYPPAGTTLGNWATHQRQRNNRGQLLSDRKQLLIDINFQWSKPRSAARFGWDALYDRLVKYKEKYGNTAVSQYYQDDLQLGRWCYNQKRLHRKGSLNPEKKARLDAIGFEFDDVETHDQKWKNAYSRLVEYWKQKGHSDFPATSKEDPNLAQWVANQRRFYRSGKLPVDRIEMLEAIDFVWNRHEDSWSQMYNRLVKYWKLKGHSDFPTSSSEDPKLSSWVAFQRAFYRSGKLSEDRIEMLEAIDFVWNRHEDSWSQFYNRLVEYWKQKGHSYFPATSKEDPNLAQWVVNQRRFYRSGKLPVDRIEMLEAIDFSWTRQRLD